MSDLTEFLLARIAEDEHDAKRALGLDLSVRLRTQAERMVHQHGSPDPPDEPNAADSLWWTAQDVVQWLTPYGPARVLAECEAKRRIVAAHPLTTDAIPQGYVGKSAGFGCSTCHDWDGMTEALGNCETLRALAMPYADHPDFRPEWRP